jgi:hypothetical protein
MEAMRAVFLFLDTGVMDTFALSMSMSLSVENAV